MRNVPRGNGARPERARIVSCAIGHGGLSEELQHGIQRRYRGSDVDGRRKRLLGEFFAEHVTATGRWA